MSAGKMLLEMGFDPELVAQALNARNNGENFETALEWLLCHEQEHAFKNEKQNNEDDKIETEASNSEDQVKKLEEKIRIRRIERETLSRKDEEEQERRRIKTGKELLEARKKLQELEMKKIIDERRKEKQADKIARQRIMAEIETDKIKRKQKLDITNNSVMPASGESSDSVTSVTKNYVKSTIQIRMSDGAILTGTFGAKEPLSAVRLFIQMNISDSNAQFSLKTTFPNRIFSYQEYDMPLEALGLVPSATLYVIKNVYSI